MAGEPRKLFVVPLVLAPLSGAFHAFFSLFYSATSTAHGGAVDKRRPLFSRFPSRTAPTDRRNFPRAYRARAAAFAAGPTHKRRHTRAELAAQPLFFLRRDSPKERRRPFPTANHHPQPRAREPDPPPFFPTNRRGARRRDGTRGNEALSATYQRGGSRRFSAAGGIMPTMSGRGAGATRLRTSERTTAATPPRAPHLCNKNYVGALRHAHIFHGSRITLKKGYDYYVR